MRNALCAIALCIGCGGDPPTSCTTGNVCEDYAASETNLMEAREKDCKALEGAFAKSPCTSAHLLGTCVTPGHETRRYYGGGTNAYTPEAASANCEHEFHGTWRLGK